MLLRIVAKCRENLPLALTLAIVLTACQTEPPAPDPEPEPVIDHARVQALLEQGRAAFARGDLDYPDDNNARDAFHAALQLDPENVDAKRGIESIVEHYLGRVRRAVDSQQWASARSMLARARLTNEQHPGIEPMARKVDMLSNAQIARIEYSRTEVSERRRSVRDKLASLAFDPRAPNCRARLIAPSDADARWLYDQLNTLPGDRRIRTEAVVALPPAIEVLCFRDPDRAP